MAEYSLTVVRADQPEPRQPREPREPREPLWRDVLGERLRSIRHDRGETLGDIATRAGVSPQYLSEMERGLKEPSSEMIAAVAGALDVTLADLALDVAERLAPMQSVSARSALTQSASTQSALTQSAWAPRASAGHVVLALAA